MIDEALDVVAARRFTLLVDGSEARPVILEIGRPEPAVAGGGFQCPWRMHGIGSSRVRYAGGVDAVQALLLALVNAASVLYTSEASRAHRLSWDGDENGLLGLPFIDAISDLVPRRSDGSKPNPLTL